MQRDDVDQPVRIRRTPQVATRWGNVDDEPDFPFDDEGAVVFCVLLDDAVVGLIQYGEEDTPQYRHAGIDLFLDPQVHGLGVGRDAVRDGALPRARARPPRLVIDPAADNLPAIRCYSAVGFRPVGVMRSYERDLDRA